MPGLSRRIRVARRPGLVDFRSFFRASQSPHLRKSAFQLRLAEKSAQVKPSRNFLDGEMTKTALIRIRRSLTIKMALKKILSSAISSSLPAAVFRPPIFTAHSSPRERIQSDSAPLREIWLQTAFAFPAMQQCNRSPCICGIAVEFSLPAP